MSLEALIALRTILLKQSYEDYIDYCMSRNNIRYHDFIRRCSACNIVTAMIKVLKEGLQNMDEKYLCINCLYCFEIFSLYCSQMEQECPAVCTECKNFIDLKQTEGL